MRNLLQWVGMAILASLVAGAPARASFIGLPAALTGSTDLVDTVTLTVSYEPGDVTATNLLGHELYVHFAGLTPVAGSYALGTAYAGLVPVDLVTFEGDYLAFDGRCSDPLLFCTYPESEPDSPTDYQSVVSLFAPTTTTGSGTLFSLTFSPALGATWSINVFGESFGFGHALYWEPAPWDFEAIPFTVLPAGAVLPQGRAGVFVSAQVTDRTDPVTPVPEPALLLLAGVGFAVAARRYR